MAVATINEAAYGKLLARTLPRVIETEADNERMIAELEKLDTRERPLTREEEKLAELMTVLIRQFEAKRYPLGHASPVEALRVFNGGTRFAATRSDSDFWSEQRWFRRAEGKALY